jgi:hypothetical protein
MNDIGDYIYEIGDISGLHISGWISSKSNSQPVELSIMVGDAMMFSIVANRERHARGVSFNGFDLLLDNDFWRLAEAVRLCTKDGSELATLQRPGIVTHKRGGNGLGHEFSYLSLMEIAGSFSGDEERAHFVKLFSDGKLEAYETLRTPEKPEDGEDEGSRLGYSFKANPEGLLFSRFVVVTIDDKYAFVGNTRRVTQLNGDDGRCVVPFPIELGSILSTETKTDGSGEPIIIYSSKHYFGEGYGSLLVFDKADRFMMSIFREKSKVDISYSGDGISITQTPVE